MSVVNFALLTLLLHTHLPVSEEFCYTSLWKIIRLRQLYCVIKALEVGEALRKYYDDDIFLLCFETFDLNVF